MKYLILMYGSQRVYDAMAGDAGAGEPAWSAAEFAAMGAFMESFGKDLADSGELVDAQGLTAPVHTRRIRLREGAPVVTDGPYAEAEEVLAERLHERAHRREVGRGPGWLPGSGVARHRVVVLLGPVHQDQVLHGSSRPQGCPAI